MNVGAVLTKRCNSQDKISSKNKLPLVVGGRVQKKHHGHRPHNFLCWISQILIIPDTTFWSYKCTVQV
jgi:hypothetical protein